MAETEHGAHVPLHHRADLDPDSTKAKVGRILEHRLMEVLIVVLIFADIILVSTELAIDHHYACVEGSVVGGKSPEEIEAMEPSWTSNGHNHTVHTMESVSEALRALPDAPEDQQTAHSDSEPPIGILSTPGEPSAIYAFHASHKRSSALLKAASKVLQSGRFLEDPAKEHPPAGAPEAHHAEGHHPEGHHAEGHHAKGHHAEGHAGGHGEEHGHAGGHEGAHGHAEGEHGHGGHHHHPPAALVCETKHGHTAHHIMHTCHNFSIAILCVFLVELLLKYWVAPKEFCASKLELLDLFVVSISLIIDVYVSYLISTDGGGVVQLETVLVLIMILRIWRVVRIIHGFSEVYAIEMEREEKEHEEVIRLKEIVRRSNLASEL